MELPSRETNNERGQRMMSSRKGLKGIVMELPSREIKNEWGQPMMPSRKRNYVWLNKIWRKSMPSSSHRPGCSSHELWEMNDYASVSNTLGLPIVIWYSFKSWCRVTPGYLSFNLSFWCTITTCCASILVMKRCIYNCGYPDADSR